MRCKLSIAIWSTFVALSVMGCAPEKCEEDYVINGGNDTYEVSGYVYDENFEPVRNADIKLCYNEINWFHRGHAILADTVTDSAGAYKMTFRRQNEKGVNEYEYYFWSDHETTTDNIKLERPYILHHNDIWGFDLDQYYTKKFTRDIYMLHYRQIPIEITMPNTSSEYKRTSISYSTRIPLRDCDTLQLWDYNDSIRLIRNRDYEICISIVYQLESQAENEYEVIRDTIRGTCTDQPTTIQYTPDLNKYSK